ncbi:hypothetical protein [Streptomyces katrae]|uniref:hypothetical protein n=1 Tax=Streptomyces katrae TaxID=68223 RepID=UPI0004C070BB|nr:hypothetical protein [Streptomyces katrae]
MAKPYLSATTPLLQAGQVGCAGAREFGDRLADRVQPAGGEAKGQLPGILRKMGAVAHAGRG